MLVIVDCNKMFSALLSKGTIFEVFSLNKSLKKIDFISPEFLFTEIGRNLGEIVERSKLSTNELSRVFNLMKEQIDSIPFEDFNEFAEEAKQLAPHNKDLKYFALALAFEGYPKIGIWSDEDAFRKQDKIDIFSTGELLRFLKE